MPESRQSIAPESQRYMGLELAGAKNEKTSLAVLEHYQKENKTFLLDVYEKIPVAPGEDSDQALLKTIDEDSQRLVKLAVNVPLTLPPCIGCNRRTCKQARKCVSPTAQWMNRYITRISKRQGLNSKSKHFTAYTQRPVELWIRHEVIPELPKSSQFEIDETLGGNRAPLTARMHFLRRFIDSSVLIEVWPKLTVAALGKTLGLSPRIVASYRHLENGAHFREEFLEAISEYFHIFIYDRDLRKLTHNLAAFDAFVCALTAVLNNKGQCTKMPREFPNTSGWVEYPCLDLDLSPLTHY